MTDIIIQGIYGRMGRALVEKIGAREDCRIVAGVDRETGRIGEIPVYAGFDALPCKGVIIDFSSPAGAVAAAQYGAANGLPCVICSTGLSREDEAALEAASTRTPIFRSANMSVGVNVLIELARQATKILGGEFDIEIIEKHHHNKLDAPSGTALMIADAINTEANGKYEYVYDRTQIRQKRGAQELGISSIRGGGVVGDLGGFCAASYMRGIDFVNCPTTVLSQVDSSIGGKTAIDLGETKNIVGAFWQPKVVLVDFDTLKTLPRRQVVNGLAEALKTGIIGDPQLFALFECEHPEDNIEQIVYRSLKFKKKIVEQDEREGSVRACLNFGHTIGHGIEAVRGVRGRRTTGLYHGECVALGMLPMIEDTALLKRTRAIYRALGLPTRAGANKKKVLAYMQHDKKARGDHITVIKCPGLGCWRADSLPMTELPALLGME